MKVMKYSILEIAGKQFKAVPGKPFEITLQEENPVAKVLMTVDDRKVAIGTPYLKETVKLKVLEQKMGEKIRVAKFHAKANFRKVRGHRAQKTRLVLSQEMVSTPGA